MLLVFNLIPLLPFDGDQAAGAMWEGAKRGWARLRGLPDPGFVDVAKALPVTYAVSILLIVVTVVFSYADIVLAHVNGLGDTSAGTTVSSGAALVVAGAVSQLANGSTIAAETLTLNGDGPTSAGALRFGTGDATTRTWSGDGHLEVDAVYATYRPAEGVAC